MTADCGCSIHSLSVGLIVKDPLAYSKADRGNMTSAVFFLYFSPKVLL
jgi:hypothetical protein